MEIHIFLTSRSSANLLITWVKRMVRQIPQALSGFQLYCFDEDSLPPFSIVFSCFRMFFWRLFRDKFLLAFLMEKGSKKTSKSDPQTTTFGQSVSFQRLATPKNSKKSTTCRRLRPKTLLEPPQTTFQAILSTLRPRTDPN